LLTAALLAVLAAPAALAQDLDGFSPAPGHGDLAFSLNFDSYDRFWVGTNKVYNPNVGQVDTDSASLWWRHGLTERLTVIATVPYVDVDSDGLAGFTPVRFSISASESMNCWPSSAARRRPTAVLPEPIGPIR
jgi:hypothetical protein